MSVQTAARPPQWRASNPEASAWVHASAGTGKTKILTDRVLRLLLSGVPPERILCITFTRAAAAEMAIRVAERLGQWAVMSDAALAEALFDLSGVRPDPETRLRARRLFALIVDAPAGFRIQTIHAFCQSVLRRFPLEAGVAPYFDLLDDRTADELLGEAKFDLLAETGAFPDRPVAHALAVLTEYMTEQGFAGLIATIVGERRKLAQTFTRYGGVGLLVPALWRRLGLEPGETEAAIVEAACRDGAFDAAALRDACLALAEGAMTDRRRAATIRAWLDSSDRPALWKDYASAFLNEDGKPNARFAGTNAHQSAAAVLDAEAERVRLMSDRLRASATARASEALLVVADALLTRFAAIKRARAVLDYDDLIELTAALLDEEGAAAWVLYKLDGGIDHLLVDEAQDTNPAQWRIVQALAREFFAGEGAKAGGRTIFVVGDEKQSIYGFQGSDPAALGRLERYFAERIEAAGETLEEVELTKSYRSTAPILELVDKVFASAAARDGVVNDLGAVIRHLPHRVGHGGLVEFWAPLAPAETAIESDPWPLPIVAEETVEPEAQLARRIAGTIAGWLNTGEILPATGRKITAGDIMILVRRRTRFVGPMLRALKAEGIPVAGIDRLSLTEPLAVQDLMALGRFLLLPEDDLTLAALLKSPLIGLDEERLFTLAHGRKGTLWSALLAAAEHDSGFEPARAWLADWLGRVDYVRPFELFAAVLSAPCPGDPSPGGSGRRGITRCLGPDALDPLDEFLSAALDFERRHAPTLEAFIGWLEASDAEIKRELATRADAVRLVTVHGAKGLESPIVFLPDTMQIPRTQQGPRLLWHEDKRGAMPFWVPRRALKPDFCLALTEDWNRQVDREYRRLLYVALTRARDRLYVCGWHGRQRPTGRHWHMLVEDGMRAAGAIEHERDGLKLLRIEQPHTAAAPAARPDSIATTPPPLPAWSGRPAPAEPRPTRPLAPSRVETASGRDEPAARSPASREEAKWFRRGRAIHRLLQILPDQPVAERAAVGVRLVADFSAAERDAMVADVLRLLDHPDCARFFGPSSRAEVPIIGRVGMRGVAGQIDRLVVEPDGITIIDFKTGRPSDLDSLPPGYAAQMAAYRMVLREIYPGRPIEAILVWTEGPSLLPLPSLLLDFHEAYLSTTF